MSMKKDSHLTPTLSEYQVHFYTIFSIQRRPHTIAEQFADKLKTDEKLKTVNGEECKIPFTFTRRGKSTSHETCIDEGHANHFWCCLEDTCDDKGNGKFGFCPKGKV